MTTEKKHRRAVTPNEVSEMYGIAEGTLANMRCRKEGPKYFKVGRRKVIYFIEDLEAWFHNQPVLTKDCISLKEGRQ